jgi:hypothetical protein
MNQQNEPLLGNYQQPPPPPQVYAQQPGQPVYYANPINYQNYPQQPYPQNNLAPRNIVYPQQPILQPQMGYGLPPSQCVFCRRDTESFSKKIPGGVAWMWCFGLFLFTGVFCCVPFCVDSCHDTQLLCVGCHGVKTTIESNCC